VPPGDIECEKSNDEGTMDAEEISTEDAIHTSTGSTGTIEPSNKWLRGGFENDKGTAFSHWFKNLNMLASAVRNPRF
jgi:hypothetical protein